MSKIKNKKTGMIALPLALLMVAVIGVVIVTTSGLGLDESNNSATVNNSLSALACARAAANSALINLARDPDYAAGSNEEVSALDCGTANVTTPVLTNNRVITATGEVGGVQRVLQVTATVNSDTGEITTTTWQELIN